MAELRRYVNPERNPFAERVNSKVYVDKTDLLEFTNSVIEADGKFICNSRPRRFGKTYTVSMLEYYYCKSFDADSIFSKLEISKSQSYKRYLNKYNLIHLDMYELKFRAGGYDKLVSYIQTAVISELHSLFPEIESATIDDFLSMTGERFIILIDEWDAPIRECEAVKNDYYDFLRSLFKGNGSDNYIALAYLTGILPVIKEKGESALNNFNRIMMTEPKELARYIGFTEDEVKKLCDLYHANFLQMKEWFDGYQLGEYSVYNPVSVLESLSPNAIFKSHWTQTRSYEPITQLIDMNYIGLKDTIERMLLGDEVFVDVEHFSSDVSSIKSVDDILTYLIHLGYLAYDAKRRVTYIPNREIMYELERAMADSVSMHRVALKLQASERVLDATLNKDGAYLSKAIESYHMAFASNLKYNNEDCLSGVIENAYYCAVRYYKDPIREFSLGKGFADLVYLPTDEYCKTKPALLIELKWDKTAETAIDQIKEKKYPDSLIKYVDNLLLVGINYNKGTKKHECVIEKYSAKPKKAVDSQKVAGGEWQKKAEEMKAREEKSVLKLANKHLSVEDIADCLSMSVDSVKEILSRRNGGTLL